MLKLKMFVALLLAALFAGLSLPAAAQLSDKKVLTLEEAVRRMTSDPADFFGIRDRGRLKPGLAADLAIFNPDTVGSLGRPERRYDLPGGAKRMVMRSQGIEYTVVNGAVTWEDGKLTGSTSGKVLRS